MSSQKKKAEVRAVFCHKKSVYFALSNGKFVIVPGSHFSRWQFFNLYKYKHLDDGGIFFSKKLQFTMSELLSGKYEISSHTPSESHLEQLICILGWIFKALVFGLVIGLGGIKLASYFPQYDRSQDQGVFIGISAALTFVLIPLYMWFRRIPFPHELHEAIYVWPRKDISSYSHYDGK